MTPRGNIAVGLVVAAVIASSWSMGANPGEFIEGLPNLAIVLDEIYEEMAEVDYRMLDRGLWSMLETILMAFVGTVVGYAMAFPLSLLASRNLASKWVYAPVRAVLAAVRTFPSILWALLFVIMVGPGPFAGILAITMYTVGFVSKLQYESIETIDSDPLDTASSIGLSKLQLVRHVVMPESASHLLGHLLYMFDYNVRQTSILGLVGAGGIGFYIITHIKFFQYGKAAFFMLVVLATVLVVDWISVKLRDKYVVKSQRGIIHDSHAPNN